MNTKEFIEDILEDGLDNNTIINFVEEQECKYLELLHTELGFLSGLVMCIEAGTNPVKVIEKRILSLKPNHNETF